MSNNNFIKAGDSYFRVDDIKRIYVQEVKKDRKIRILPEEGSTSEPKEYIETTLMGKVIIEFYEINPDTCANAFYAFEEMPQNSQRLKNLLDKIHSQMSPYILGGR